MTWSITLTSHLLVHLYVQELNFIHSFQLYGSSMTEYLKIILNYFWLVTVIIWNTLFSFEFFPYYIVIKFPSIILHNLHISLIIPSISLFVCKIYLFFTFKQKKAFTN